ncbi:thiamine phosphate synthase [Methylobacterium oxalidis]|uniref:Thiamine phosphate synthase n=1 Tax=Methylobacterium oxalidis TaxID=944322 RepID=A0A512IZ06_9HYPH|nr:thiamine phosphate synthase [Methylobacterium oxalidis]GEP02938.1 thiamine phosphate synthase [Methylobacterium oxalidis]GJE30275.1 Thiamine-phosphate synthase [Methylobacterium oxalidis]GLS65871.1 thiamine phosphate synthase [Methylobacterium oxalidis]
MTDTRTDPTTRLSLLTPHRLEAGQLDPLLPALDAACAAGDVAALILRLAPADERTLVGLVKRVAAVTQKRGAALVVACPGLQGDIVSVAARGGADGVHLDRPGAALLRDLRERLKDGRILGTGGIENRHGAMEAGEAGIDYLAFGGLYPDGAAPDPAGVLERSAWWAEIFETPCIAVAAAEAEIAALAGTGAEFLGLEAAIWTAGPEAVERAQAALAGAAS